MSPSPQHRQDSSVGGGRKMKVQPESTCQAGGASPPETTCSETPEARLKYSLLYVYATVGFDMAGFGIVLPLVPFYLATVFGPQGGNSATIFGVFTSLYALAQAGGAYLFGILGDKPWFGRKNALLVGWFGSCAAFLTLALATDLRIVMFARALSGLSGGTVSAAQAYVASKTQTPPRVAKGSVEAERYAEVRTQAMTQIGALKGIGFVMGPPLGAALFWLLDSNFRACFAVPGIAAVIMLVLGIIILESDTQHSSKKINSLLESDSNEIMKKADINSSDLAEPLLLADESKEISHAVMISNAALKIGSRSSQEQRTLEIDTLSKKIFRFKAVFYACVLLICLDYTANCMVETVFPFIAKDLLGWGPKQYAFLFLTFGLALALTQMLITPKIVNRGSDNTGCGLGEVRTIIIGFILRALALLSVTNMDLVEIPLIVVTANCLIAVGAGLLESNVNVMVANAVDEIGSAVKLRKKLKEEGSDGEIKEKLTTSKKNNRESSEDKAENDPEYGSYMGFLNASGMIALAIAPNVGGYLYDHYGLLVNSAGAAVSLVSLSLAIGMVWSPECEMLGGKRADKK